MERKISSTARVAVANKGIGFAIARQLGEHGMRVYLGARDDDRGRAAELKLRSHGINVHYLRLDVTDESPAALAAKLLAALGDDGPRPPPWRRTAPQPDGNSRGDAAPIGRPSGPTTVGGLRLLVSAPDLHPPVDWWRLEGG